MEKPEEQVKEKKKSERSSDESNYETEDSTDAEFFDEVIKTEQIKSKYVIDQDKDEMNMMTMLTEYEAKNFQIQQLERLKLGKKYIENFLDKGYEAQKSMYSLEKDLKSKIIIDLLKSSGGENVHINVLLDNILVDFLTAHKELEEDFSATFTFVTLMEKVQNMELKAIDKLYMRMKIEKLKYLLLVKCKEEGKQKA
jgi:hypothetical protein